MVSKVRKDRKAEVLDELDGLLSDIEDCVATAQAPEQMARESVLSLTDVVRRQLAQIRGIVTEAELAIVELRDLLGEAR